MERVIVDLNIGGKIFRTTKSTLCNIDGYFSRMLKNDSWLESSNCCHMNDDFFEKLSNINVDNNDNSNNSSHYKNTDNSSSLLEKNDKLKVIEIFIDRDHNVFDDILSYLRCGRSFVSNNLKYDDIYLERLLVEADYYCLDTLVDDIKIELNRRKVIELNKQRPESYKVVVSSEVNYYFDRGWSYVESYQGNDTTSCIISGPKMESLYRSNQCTGCGETMSFDKFIKHASYFKPTMIVLKKTYNVCNNIQDQLMMNISSNNTTNSSISPLAGTGGSIDNSILFDQSFG